jgi:RNA polymerase sigma-70 factor, ECF subfamily
MGSSGWAGGRIVEAQPAASAKQRIAARAMAKYSRPAVDARASERLHASGSARGAYPGRTRRKRTDPKASDQALLEAHARQDPRALAELYDRYAGPALALAARILSDRTEAEDVLQGVFTRVWSEAGRFDASKGSPAAWLLSAVRHAAIDRFRRRDVRQRAERREPETSAPARLSEEQERVTEAVRRLPLDQREAIELAYFDGLSQTEIAERLAQPLGTVKTRIRLGMSKLRQALTGLAEEVV